MLQCIAPLLTLLSVARCSWEPNAVRFPLPLQQLHSHSAQQSVPLSPEASCNSLQGPYCMWSTLPATRTWLADLRSGNYVSAGADEVPPLRLRDQKVKFVVLAPGTSLEKALEEAQEALVEAQQGKAGGGANDAGGRLSDAEVRDDVGHEVAFEMEVDNAVDMDRLVEQLMQAMGGALPADEANTAVLRQQLSHLLSQAEALASSADAGAEGGAGSTGDDDGAGDDYIDDDDDYDDDYNDDDEDDYDDDDDDGDGVDREDSRQSGVGYDGNL